MKKFLFAIALALMTVSVSAASINNGCEGRQTLKEWLLNTEISARKDGIELKFVPMRAPALDKFKTAMIDNMKENGFNTDQLHAFEEALVGWGLIVWAAFEYHGAKSVGLAAFDEKDCFVEGSVWSEEHFFNTMKKAVGPKEIGKGSI